MLGGEEREGGRLFYIQAVDEYKEGIIIPFFLSLSVSLSLSLSPSNCLPSHQCSMRFVSPFHVLLVSAVGYEGLVKAIDQADQSIG